MMISSVILLLDAQFMVQDTIGFLMRRAMRLAHSFPLSPPRLLEASNMLAHSSPAPAPFFISPLVRRLPYDGRQLLCWHGGKSNT